MARAARARPRRPQRQRGSAGGLGLVERLVLVLLSHPEVLEERPLPEGLEELDIPQLDLLIQVDGARLSELIKALAEARNRARQAPISD